MVMIEILPQSQIDSFRAKAAAIDHPEARRKLREFDEAVAAAAGVWVDVSAARAQATPASEVSLALTAVNRSRANRAVCRWKPRTASRNRPGGQPVASCGHRNRSLRYRPPGHKGTAHEQQASEP